ncbi:glutaredoxin domain-containing protein [Streptomyces sp. NPDC006290]|uniref:glutaredoxin domain-containing protein n=1 Tax=Streptomyces sp. NPDC006290 TaxID=3156745 RepID=UPI0033A927F2
MTGNDEGVVVYRRPLCPYCMKLRLRLRFSRLRYTEKNIWADPEAAAFVRSSRTGTRPSATVTVAGTSMVNPSKRQVMSAVATHAPHLLARGRP